MNTTTKQLIGLSRAVAPKNALIAAVRELGLKVGVSGRIYNSKQQEVAFILGEDHASIIPVKHPLRSPKRYIGRLKRSA